MSAFMTEGNSSSLSWFQRKGKSETSGTHSGCCFQTSSRGTDQADRRGAAGGGALAAVWPRAACRLQGKHRAAASCSPFMLQNTAAQERGVIQRAVQQPAPIPSGHHINCFSTVSTPPPIRPLENNRPALSLYACTVSTVRRLMRLVLVYSDTNTQLPHFAFKYLNS